MIVDTIEKMGDYEKVLPELALVKRILDSGVVENADCADYTTEDPKVHYAISRYLPHPKGALGYEVHHDYADVQIVLAGNESIDIAKPSSLLARGPYQSDIQFFDGKLAVSCSVEKGMFLVIFPGEAHEPSIQNGPVEEVHKVVFKVKVR